MHEQETVEIIYGVNPVKEALRAGMPIERAYTCRAQGAVLPLIGQLVGQAVACMVDGQPFFVFFGAQDIIPIDKPDFPHGRYPLRWRSTS